MSLRLSWLRFLACSTTIVLFVFPQVAMAGLKGVQAPPPWFWGCWVVKRSLPTRGISGLSQKQEDAVVGSRFVLQPKYASWGRVVLHKPKYSVTVLSARDFFELGYFPLSQIGIHARRVTEVNLDLPDHLSDLDFVAEEVFLREKDQTLVLNVENATFLAVRAKTSNAKCECRKMKVR